jgi:acetyl/propionyl-CoA carboxylase alpha subunit
VELVTDGRYDAKPKEYEDLIGNRLWVIEGVQVQEHGVHVRMLTEMQVQRLSMIDVDVRGLAVELRIVGAEPEMVVLPKSSYLKLMMENEELKAQLDNALRPDSTARIYDLGT